MGNSKIARTNKLKYGDDFYGRIGAMGGKAEHKKPRGFAALSPERLKEISKKGREAKKKHLE